VTALEHAAGNRGLEIEKGRFFGWRGEETRPPGRSEGAYGEVMQAPQLALAATLE